MIIRRVYFIPVWLNVGSTFFFQRDPDYDIFWFFFGVSLSSCSPGIA